MTETGTVLHPQTEGRRRDVPTAQTVRIVSSVRSADRIDAETPEVSVPSAGIVRRKDVTAIERIVSREGTETATGTVNMGVTVIEMDASREAIVTEIATAGRDAGPERGAIAAAVIREAAAPAFRHQP